MNRPFFASSVVALALWFPCLRGANANIGFRPWRRCAEIGIAGGGTCEFPLSDRMSQTDMSCSPRVCRNARCRARQLKLLRTKPGGSEEA